MLDPRRTSATAPTPPLHGTEADPRGSPAAYVTALHRRGRVLADIHERRETIRQGVLTAATRLGGNAVISEDLLDEVTALVEWPVPLGRSLRRALPRTAAEVPIATMQDTSVTSGARRTGRLDAVVRDCGQSREQRPAQIVAGQRARGAAAPLPMPRSSTPPTASSGSTRASTACAA